MSINFRMSFLVDLENLCLFDKAKNVASNVFLLMLVPWQTGCSSSDRSLNTQPKAVPLNQPVDVDHQDVMMVLCQR